MTEENWRDGGEKDANFLESETPYYVGRAVVLPRIRPGSRKESRAACSVPGDSPESTASRTSMDDSLTGTSISRKPTASPSPFATTTSTDPGRKIRWRQPFPTGRTYDDPVRDTV